jgi:predicted metal-dependent HD superfamily phosphohydrolase
VENGNASSARSALFQRWCELLGDRTIVRELGAAVLHRWSEPHRRYHGLAHLAAVLDHVDDLARAQASPETEVDAVRLATYFHDVVYDPESSDNEVRSAALAADVLGRVEVPAALVAEVVRLVLLTASHEPAAGDHAGALLCDADLAVLGGEPEAYAAYAAAVREEYRHVPEPLFRAGRAAILEGLLGHEELYRTAAARSRWEQAARRNLGAELLLLSAQPDLEGGSTGAGQPPGAA